MRERRWETRTGLDFNTVLEVGERLARLGLKPAPPEKEIICYIEEWTVEAPDEIGLLDPWPTEDITLVHVREGWRGDFFLLAGAYHTVYLRHQETGTYCSISHPWRIHAAISKHFPRAMFWLGFRHTHAFVRVRVHTAEVMTPGETRGNDKRDVWLDERVQAFREAIDVLNVPISCHVEEHQVVVRGDTDGAPLFCSWPDAFGPCQFEYNSSDPFEFLVPASRLAMTDGGELATVRAYLTGFSEEALDEYQPIMPGSRSAYRCSAHCPIDDLPEVLQTIAPEGRLYATLCEFQTQELLPDGHDASAIIGIVGGNEGFQIEVRLNRAPLEEEHMAPWLETLVGWPVSYAPLPPFPEP